MNFFSSKTHISQRHTGKLGPGTLQKPENRDASGTLQKTVNMDPSGTQQKPDPGSQQDPRKTGKPEPYYYYHYYFLLSALYFLLTLKYPLQYNVKSINVNYL